MKTRIISNRQILRGYSVVSALYPHIPPLSHWRAWEYAAYQNYKLKGTVLDLGCGDGRYFKLLWPKLKHVVGVDLDPAVAELGRQSGVYNRVHVAPAHKIPEANGIFDQVFANCSLEHMDDLDAVLGEIFRCLKPDGTLLCSVVTDRFVEWALLPNLVANAGYLKESNTLREEFLNYHHLSNPLSVPNWISRFSAAGFVTEEHIPILPKINSGMFLLMDNLWHIKRKDTGELGDSIYSFLTTNAKFPSAFQKIFEGLLEMESNMIDCSGAVFLVRKPGSH